ncbi:MAG: methyltransferase [Potamolinea sp.]
MLTTKEFFIGVVAVVFLQRLFELRISQRNVAYLLAQGGREHGSNYLWLVKLLQLSWFVAMIAEVLLLDRPFVPALAVVGVSAAIAGQILRYLSMRTLGKRWTLPIITIPGIPLVTNGIYCYLRHPNWLGVILEIAGIPLIHTAYLTAIFFTLSNAVLMVKRIQREEQALSKDNNYAYVFAGQPHFIPSIRLRVNFPILMKLLAITIKPISLIIPASLVMYSMISSFWVSRAIYIAAKLGIADYLQQPKTVEELATLTDTHAPSLYRILRALASVGIFAEDDKHRFRLTPLAATLQTDATGSLRFMAIAELGDERYLGWGNFLHSVKTGETAFDQVTGMSIWDYYAQNPENGKFFNLAMTDLTANVVEAVLESYDFSSLNTVVDVGGGQGSLISAILKANPTLKGILFDMPSVIEDAIPKLAADGVADRCVGVGGNFFESVPGGGDAYLLKWIIHDWDDSQAIAILRNCYQAMSDNGKLLLIELVVFPGNDQPIAKLMDLNMLVMMGGRERTETEYRALLQAAGFQLTRIIFTRLPVNVIEAIKT